jgi:hypothetical protein
VLGLVHVLAFASWAVIIVVWVLAIYQGGEQKLWPYARIYADPATLLLAFICLGAPIVSLAFSLPFHAVRFVLASFLKLDDEGRLDSVQGIRIHPNGSNSVSLEGFWMGNSSSRALRG